MWSMNKNNCVYLRKNVLLNIRSLKGKPSSLILPSQIIISYLFLLMMSNLQAYLMTLMIYTTLRRLSKKDKYILTTS
jgi:hypothetical protein